MSGHIACICGNRKNWKVIHRNHNHSYFESPKGCGHYSNYSQIRCFSKGCNGNFRSKGSYVNGLPDAIWNNNKCERE